MRPENTEFLALFKLSGWTQVQAAKRFHCSQAVISRWLNNVDPADKKAIDLFKFILSHEQPDKLSPFTLKEEGLAHWEKKILDDLRWLHQADRENVLAMLRTLIDRLPKREPVNYKIPIRAAAKKCRDCEPSKKN